MTYKEALSKITECGLNIEEPLHSELMEIVKVALEKQIPSKVLGVTETENGDYGVCPCCHRVVLEVEALRNCSICGQALDWSDTE